MQEPLYTHSNSGTEPEWSRTEPGTYGAIVSAVERNPVLALAAVGAVGAIVAVALMPSRTPRSRLKSFERRLEREARNLERRIRSSADRSGLSDGLGNLLNAAGQRLAAMDSSQLDPFKDRAATIAGRIIERIGALGR